MFYWLNLLYKLSKAVTVMSPLDEKHLEIAYADNGDLTERGRELYDYGVEVLKSGRVFGAVILSGGEGTRLGLDYPKGLFEIEGKTLFDWHLARLKELHKEFKAKIHLFVMTSNATDAKVKEFFKGKKLDFLTGIDIFKQSSIEAIDMETKEPLRLNGEIVMNPIGNGDFFDAVKRAPNMDKVEYFNVISVDNVLANILDPVAIGTACSRKLDVLSKAVKAQPNESVGAFFIEGNYIKIQEYSESKNPNGADMFGNICNHIFAKDFVKRIGDKKFPMHEAYKKIPYSDKNGNVVKPTKPNGIKREKFIFDAFDFTTKNAVLAVVREHEFAPLKNSTEAATDNKHTCAAALKKTRRATAARAA